MGDVPLKWELYETVYKAAFARIGGDRLDRDLAHDIASDTALAAVERGESVDNPKGFGCVGACWRLRDNWALSRNQVPHSSEVEMWSPGFVLEGVQVSEVKEILVRSNPYRPGSIDREAFRLILEGQTKDIPPTRLSRIKKRIQEMLYQIDPQAFRLGA